MSQRKIWLNRGSFESLCTSKFYDSCIVTYFWHGRLSRRVRGDGRPNGKFLVGKLCSICSDCPLRRLLYEGLAGIRDPIAGFARL